MTVKQHQSQGLEDLLKRTLADDLPADVEAGMRERIAFFRAGIMKDEGRRAAWAWLFRRSAWAVLSILMLVAGILLQGLGPRNPLADRIARIKTEFSSSESPRQPGVSSEFRMLAPDGRPIYFLFEKEIRL